MTKRACAETLYDLIVIKGRRKGKEDIIFGDKFDDLPEWIQELWLTKADEFALMNGFTFVEDGTDA